MDTTYNRPAAAMCSYPMMAEYAASVVMRSGSRCRGAAFSKAARLFSPASRVTCTFPADAPPATAVPLGVAAGDADGDDVEEGSGMAAGVAVGVDVNVAGAITEWADNPRGTACIISWQLGCRVDWGPAPAQAHLSPLFHVQRGVSGGGTIKGYLH